VVVGYAGLFHLGIAAFFGIGAYTTGILTVKIYPFQVGFLASAVLSMAAAAAVAVLISLPTLRLRGDYFALVTLGFGEVVVFCLRNLESITQGSQGLNPVPPPVLPSWLKPAVEAVGIRPDWLLDYRLFYYQSLLVLVVVLGLLRNLERSRLGRGWAAIREDELAAASMGLNPARLKLAAVALGAAIAGLAGCLYVTRQSSTGGPLDYGFIRSITILCCLILGGLGSRLGVVLGVFLLLGFDNILTQGLDRWMQREFGRDLPDLWRLANWKLMLIGLVLIVVTRFRPEGILPSSRVKRELHEADEAPTGVPTPGA
jgi:branched-chain amino acid transport system permease protein